MPSLRIMWTYLAPSRRRRRYYFLAVLARLQELGVDREHWPGTFNVQPMLFAEWLSGYTTPREFVQTLAIMGYKVPRPPRMLVYGPALMSWCFVGGILLTWTLSRR
jgi:hypothetical protein